MARAWGKGKKTPAVPEDAILGAATRDAGGPGGRVGATTQTPPPPRHPLELRRPYLSLRQPQRAGQLGPLRQRQVLRPLEPALQLLDLERRVDGPRLAHLLALAVDPSQLAILDALLDVVCKFHTRFSLALFCSEKRRVEGVNSPPSPGGWCWGESAMRRIAFLYRGGGGINNAAVNMQDKRGWAEGGRNGR